MRYAMLPFERFAALKPEQWIDEVGSPNERQSGNYYQVEAELLDYLVEDGVDVLHVSVVARDEYREFGTDLFIYKDGRYRWERQIFEFVNGISVVVGK